MIARFDPAIQKVVRQARTRLRKRLPAAVELVYDNYNALAIGYGSSEKKRDLIVFQRTGAGAVRSQPAHDRRHRSGTRLPTEKI